MHATSTPCELWQHWSSSVLWQGIPGSLQWQMPLAKYGSHDFEQQLPGEARLHNWPAPPHPGSSSQTPPEQLRLSPQLSSSGLFVVAHCWLTVSQVAFTQGFLGSRQKGNFWEHVHCFWPFGPTHWRVRHWRPRLQGAPPGRLPAASVAPRAVRRPPAVTPPRSRLNPRREYVMPKERMRVSKCASSMIPSWYEARVRCSLTIEGGGHTVKQVSISVAGCRK